MKYLYIVLCFFISFQLNSQTFDELLKKIPAQKDKAVLRQNKKKLRNQIGNFFLYQKYDSAISYSHNLLNVIQKHKLNSNLTYLFNHIGFSYERLGDLDSSKLYFNKVRSIGADKIPYKDYLSAISHLASYYFDEGNYNEALAYYLEHLKISETKTDTFRIIGSLNNIGNVYLEITKPRKALEYYTRAIHFIDKKSDPCKYASALILVGSANSDIGYHENKQNFIDSALITLNVARSLSKTCEDQRFYSIALSNISNIYNSRGEYDKAIELLNQTISIKLSNEYPDISIDYYNLGDCYLKKKSFAKANEAFQKALSYSDELSLNEFVAIYNALAKSFSITKDFTKAYYYQHLESLYKDSLHNQTSLEKRKELEMNFEFEKKEEIQKVAQDKKDFLSAQELKEQKQQRVYFGIGLLFAIAFSVYILFSLKKQRAANKIISEQKEEVEKQKHLIEEKQKEIIDSIKYAKRIQQSLLPTEKYIIKKLNK